MGLLFILFGGIVLALVFRATFLEKDLRQEIYLALKSKPTSLKGSLGDLLLLFAPGFVIGLAILPILWLDTGLPVGGHSIVDKLAMAIASSFVFSPVFALFVIFCYLASPIAGLCIAGILVILTLLRALPIGVTLFIGLFPVIIFLGLLSW